MKLRYLTVVSVFILLAVRMFRAVDLYAVNIFYCDQWVFNDATLFQNHSLLQIFRWQYGPHRQGLGGILLKLFEPLIQWNSRYEAFAIAGIIVCACLAALWLKCLLFGKIDYSDVIIPLLFFTPIQFDSLVGGANPSHGPLPLLLAVLYCVAWTIRNQFWKHATVLSLNILLVYTGFGLFMGLITPLLLGVQFYRRRSRTTLISLAIAVVSIGSFFIDYRSEPAVGCFSPHLQNPIKYVLFVGFMFSSFVNVHPTAGLVFVAMVVGLGLLAFLSLTAGVAFAEFVRSTSQQAGPLIISALLGYSLAFCFATAYGRTCMGIASGQASRYMVYLILAFLALYFAALSVPDEIKRRAFVSVVLLIALLSSARLESQAQRSLIAESQQRRIWRDCYLSAHTIDQCDAASGSFIYLPPEPPDLKSKLDFLQRNHLNLFSGVSASYARPVSPGQ